MYSRFNEVSLNRIASFLNFDKNSSSCGSFDRYYWGWKKKDFSDSTLQYALVPFLKADADNVNIKYICRIAFTYLNRILHSNGTCDQSYPYENHPKTFLDNVPLVVEVIENRNSFFSSSLIDLAINILRRGVDYAIAREEDYATIANHIAHDMYQYLLTYSVLHDEKYYQKAVENLYLIEKNTDEEGWHKEYCGGDAGYQTRSLKYLTKCLALLNDRDKALCERLCLKSAEFLDQLILPDGTIYSMFGSRNTSILYPSGIEYMAYHYPEKFSCLAYRIRQSIKKGKAMVPLQLDFDNFIRLFDDFLGAQIYYEKNKDLDVAESGTGDFDLPNFGFKRTTVGDCQVFVHYKYGSSVAIYKGDDLFFKDAGFLIKEKKHRYWGTKNVLTWSDVLENNRESIRTRTIIFRSSHVELTPLKLIVLRLLNLTFMRITFFADRFRHYIVGKMITGKKQENYGTVTRKIHIDEMSLVISDEFRLRFIPEKVYRTIFLHLFHMASSRYFHPVDGNSYCSEEEDGPWQRSFILERKVQLADINDLRD